MPKSISKTTPPVFAAILGLSLFTAWLIIGGCRGKLVDKQDFSRDYSAVSSIRVLLDKSKTSYEVTSEGICSVNTSSASQKYTKAKFRVAVQDNSISVNGKVVGQKVEIEPRCPAVFSFNGKKYRGKIAFSLENGKLLAINTLDIESYLGGVVGAEMPAYWNKEALKAQAITARTYSIFIRDEFGRNRSWDVRSTQANQVYKGISAEYPQIWAAVEETKAKVLTCSQSKHECGLFPAYFSSICGGHTENSKLVFGDEYAALKGVECPYCRKVSGKKFFSWDKYAMSKEKAYEKLCSKYPTLKKLESLDKIEPARVSKYKDFERITRFKIVGKNGKSDIVGGEDLRLSLDSSGSKIKSPAFKISCSKSKITFSNGRGFGHGVGLCQYGALGMAKKGYDCNAILEHYYPSSEIVTYY